jgi:hypothetical protein
MPLASQDFNCRCAAGPHRLLHVKPNAIASSEHLLEADRDDVLLRFSLGSEYLKTGDSPAARGHRGSG